MNPLFLPPPTRAARSCSLNMTRNRNTIPTRTKSPTKKSCSRPMCRRSLQTAILYGTQPKRRKNNGTPSLPGDSCLPSQGKSRRDSTPTLSVTTAAKILFDNLPFITYLRKSCSNNDHTDQLIFRQIYPFRKNSSHHAKTDKAFFPYLIELFKKHLSVFFTHKRRLNSRRNFSALFRKNTMHFFHYPIGRKEHHIISLFRICCTHNI